MILILQRTLAGVPIENQRDRKELLFTRSITLLGNAARIMNNSKVFALPTPPTELIMDK